MSGNYFILCFACWLSLPEWKCASASRPLVHTYVEDFDTSNFDKREILDNWERSWQQAGWDTQILSNNNTKNNKGSTLDDEHHPLLHKWMAMSHVGGFYSSYFVVPLLPHTSTTISQPEDDKFIIYEVIAPTLMYGTPRAWQIMTEQLGQNFKNHKEIHAGEGLSYWTDGLALLDLPRTEFQLERRVLSVDDSILFFDVDEESLSVNHTAEVVSKRCSKLQKQIYRKQKWAVHFGPLALQQARSVPLVWKEHPRHAVDLAKAWFRDVKRYCGASVLPLAFG